MWEHRTVSNKEFSTTGRLNPSETYVRLMDEVEQTVKQAQIEEFSHEAFMDYIPRRGPWEELPATEMAKSDPRTSYIGPAGSIPLGVQVIEKHVTLNKNMAGPDHLASLNFEEFNNMTEFCNKIYLAMGTSKKSFLNSEKILHGILSRKIVARQNIPSGKKISMKHLKTVLTYKQGGLEPKKIYKITGKKASTDIMKGSLINQKSIKK